MNPNQMNVAKARVAQHEFREEARRSRLQAEAEHEAKASTPRKAPGFHPLSRLISLGFSGRR